MLHAQPRHADLARHNRRTCQGKQHLQISPINGPLPPQHIHVRCSQGLKLVDFRRNDLVGGKPCAKRRTELTQRSGERVRPARLLPVLLGIKCIVGGLTQVDTACVEDKVPHVSRGCLDADVQDIATQRTRCRGRVPVTVTHVAVRCRERVVVGWCVAIRLVEVNTQRVLGIVCTW